MRRGRAGARPGRCGRCFSVEGGHFLRCIDFDRPRLFVLEVAERELEATEQGVSYRFELHRKPEDPDTRTTLVVTVTVIGEIDSAKEEVVRRILESDIEEIKDLAENQES